MDETNTLTNFRKLLLDVPLDKWLGMKYFLAVLLYHIYKMIGKRRKQQRLWLF